MIDCYGSKEAFDFVVLSSSVLGLALMFVMMTDRFFGDFTLRAFLSTWALLVLYATIAIFIFLIISSNASVAEVAELFEGGLFAVLWRLIKIGITAALPGSAIMFASCIAGYVLRHLLPEKATAA